MERVLDKQTAATRSILRFQGSALQMVKQQMILDIWSNKKGFCYSA